MNKHVELERKFLITAPPKGLNRKSAARIVQGYFPTSKGIEIRLRRMGAQHFLTIKAGRGASRQEEEVQISKAKFQAFWPLTRGAQISKTRHKIAYCGNKIEVDIYHGVHRGLVTAEIEFDSLRACRAFEPPPWVEREITGRRRYANATLARQCSVTPRPNPIELWRFALDEMSPLPKGFVA